MLAISLSTSVGAGFLLATIDAPPAAFYGFALAFTAAVAMQILAPGAGLRSPLVKQDGDPR